MLTVWGRRNAFNVQKVMWLVGELALAHRHVPAGDTITLADIAAGTHLYRYFELDIARPDIPHVQAWYERLKARPAYRTHVMIPFDDLRGKLD